MWDGLKLAHQCYSMTTFCWSVLCFYHIMATKWDKQWTPVVFVTRCCTVSIGTPLLCYMTTACWYSHWPWLLQMLVRDLKICLSDRMKESCQSFLLCSDFLLCCNFLFFLAVWENHIQWPLFTFSAWRCCWFCKCCYSYFPTANSFPSSEC